MGEPGIGSDGVGVPNRGSNLNEWPEWFKLESYCVSLNTYGLMTTLLGATRRPLNVSALQQE